MRNRGVQIRKRNEKKLQRFVAQDIETIALSTHRSYTAFSVNAAPSNNNLFSLFSRSVLSQIPFELWD